LCIAGPKTWSNAFVGDWTTLHQANEFKPARLYSTQVYSGQIRANNGLLPNTEPDGCSCCMGRPINAVASLLLALGFGAGVAGQRFILV